MEEHEDFNENERQHYMRGRQINLVEAELTPGKLFLFLVAYFVIPIAVIFVAAVIATLIDLIFQTNMVNLLDQIQYLSLLELVAFLITMLIFKSARNYLQGKFQFQVFKQWQTYLFIIGAYFVVYYAQYLFNYVLEWEQAGSQVGLFGLDQIELNFINISLLVIAFVVIAPITEEIIFRGLIFGFIKDKLGLAVALIVSAIIFGMLHLGHHLSTAVIGLVFALLYYRTKSLVVPIVFHMIWNALATYGLLSLVISSG
ncbi:type II CAAX endopeptidase family protein [Amphibacillus indicireducens]|uniref:CAAX prenyl protease 2/Lysostaphin resistance protein A-like domain-containing protein n=1 Tax=Amphibacillus indicireducens TaxID=1076330 RepID=A0ABP7V0Y9_9BACI